MPESHEEESHENFHQMMNNAVVHEVQEWMEALDKDGTEKLLMIINASVSYPGYGSLMIGQLQGQLRWRYGICLSCGQNHEESVAEFSETLEKETPDQIPGTPLHSGDASAFESLGIPARPYREYLALCVKYNVTNSLNENEPVYCKNCNMPYPNLDDRMLRGPDDCSGCQVNAKTGTKFPPPSKQ